MSTQNNNQQNSGRFRRQNHRGNGRGNGRGNESAPTRDSPHMRANTPGAENVIFRLPNKTGRNTVAAVFEENLKTLAEVIPTTPSFKKGGPVISAHLLELKKPKEVEPPAPQADASEFEKLAYTKKCEEELNRREQFKTNNETLYFLLLQHCTSLFKSKLETMDTYARIKSTMDGIELAKLIKQISYSQDGGKMEMSIANAAEGMMALHTCKQEPSESNHVFIKRLLSYKDVVSAHGFALGWHNKTTTLFLKYLAESTVGINENDPRYNEKSAAAIKRATKETDEEYMAALAIALADPKRYTELRRRIKAELSHGRDIMPKDLAAALAQLDDWYELYPVGDARHLQQNIPSTQKQDKQGEEKPTEAQGMAFMQQQKDGTSGLRVNSKGESECHICGETDHWKESCPQRQGKEGVSGMQQASNSVSNTDDSDGEMWFEEGCNHYQQTSESPAGDDKAYIDTCTTYSTIDEQFLTDVRGERVGLHVKCNAGVMVLNKTGKLGDLSVWSRAKGQGIANLLSLSELEIFLRENDGRLTYDSDGEWILTLQGETHVLQRDTDGRCAGMPYIPLSVARTRFKVKTPPVSWATVARGRTGSAPLKMITSADTKDKVTDSSFHQFRHIPNQDILQGGSFMQETVRGNMERFSKRQVEGAKRARELQVMIGNPPDRLFRELVRDKRLHNCNVSLNDVTNALAIYGQSRAVLRGGSTRRKPRVINTGYDIEIPRDFFKLHRFVTLAADVMFVNEIPFLTSVSLDIGFLTAEFLPSRRAENLGKSLTKIIQFYAKGGFIVRVVLVDNEFAPLTDILPLVEVDATAAGEHVALIERQHRTIKERARSVLAELHYSYFPTQMIIHLIYHVVLWLNATTFKLGNYSAREFITGRTLDINLHCQAPFGSYIEPSEDPSITNTMSWRTEPSIALGSVGNISGTQKVLGLISGQVRRRRNIANRVLPCPDSIIRMVNDLAIKNKLEKYGRKLQFLDRTRKEYEWNEDDVMEDDDSVVYTSHREMAAEMPGVTWASDFDHLHSDNPAHVLNGMDETTETTGVDDPTSVDETTGVDDVPEVDEFAGVDELAGVDEFTGVDDLPVDSPDFATETVDLSDEDLGESLDVHGHMDFFDDNVALDDTAGVNTTDDHTLPRYPSRLRTQPTAYEPTMTGKSYPIASPTAHEAQMHYQEATAQEPLLTMEDCLEHMTGVVMMQQFYYSKGLKMFGDKGNAAVTKELQQMHDMEAYTPIDAASLSDGEKQDAINQLMFLTQKRCGKVKARSCADGRKQRGYISKADAYSPTVSIEAIFLTMCIEAHENRHVATMDIPGAFLHTDIDEDVVMQLRGKLAELMVQVDPKLYRKYVVMENGQKVLYVKAQKAVYGLLRSSLLFYRKLRGDLERLGFEFNPYDPCTANKMIDDKQMTVVFHVDDLKVSHIDLAQIQWFATEMKKVYGDKLTINTGKIHDYLGMMIDYSEKGKVQVSMIEFIKKTIAAFPEEIISKSETPAADYLFRVREEGEAKYLEEERADMFHSVTAMLLFLCGRARRDIQTAVSFLTTRVKQPDEDDWGKLKRILKYLKGTMYMKLTLEVDNMGILQWWIDSSHNVHVDCRGHTGTMLSLGKGAALSSSTKQKLNTRSSTETEMVGTYDGLPSVLWCRHFVEAQGYSVDHNIVNQDNQSTILLLRNGRASSTKRTKHIHARYFYIKDKIDKDEIEIQYCPTEKMWADVNTKPLQGRSFRIMRSHLMNIPEDYNDETERLNTYQVLGGPRPNPT